jgi:signal transduction histidine kinase
VLNRFAGYADPAATRRFLARVEAAGGDDPEFRRGCEAQDRRENVLRALRREQPGFPRGSPPVLHRNVFAGPETLFYVRQFGSEGARRVLSVDGTKFTEFLDSVQEAARHDAMQGVVPSILPSSDAPAGDAPRAAIGGLPGWVATATISDRAVRERAAKSERIYWYIIGFSIAGIIAGGLFTARVVMREVRLAKLKSGFVSNVSHGLKTPLTSIRMFSEMLRSGQVSDEEERKECLDVILQETTRLGQLIQQVLDFGRLEARQRAFAWITGSLAPLVQREAERFRRATGLGDRFEAHVAVNLPAVTFDPDAFREVVSNLLSNAYKYSPPADRRIELTLGPQGGRVVLAVEDNGPGIPPRERRRIFDKFYRANDLLTREVEGTGLGLSIVRNIVRAHGGRIEVGDAEIGGSRFAVVLPSASRRARPARPAPAETTS